MVHRDWQHVMIKGLYSEQNARYAMYIFMNWIIKNCSRYILCIDVNYGFFV